MTEAKHASLTHQIIGAFFKVYNILGYGFSEKVYQNSLILELKKLGLTVQSPQPIKVYYEGVAVGEYFADIVVNETVMLELKAVHQLLPEHEAQLLNFGPKAETKRKTFDNERKGSLAWTKSGTQIAQMNTDLNNYKNL